MSTYFFKTNVNCTGCASRIKPHLDRLEQSGQIDRRHVIPLTPEHLPQIETQKMTAEEVKD